MTDHRLKERIGAAVHEGGHAVVLYAMGLSICEIQIGIDGDDTKGRVTLKNPEAQQQLPLVDQIAICVSGIEAQKIFESPTHELAGHDDLGKVVVLLEDIPEPEAFQMREAGYKRAHDLVLMHKAEVLNVAARLVEHGKVPAAEWADLMKLGAK
jgi:hypothetical protein